MVRRVVRMGDGVVCRGADVVNRGVDGRLRAGNRQKMRYSSRGGGFPWAGQRLHKEVRTDRAPGPQGCWCWGAGSPLGGAGQARGGGALIDASGARATCRRAPPPPPRALSPGRASTTARTATEQHAHNVHGRVTDLISGQSRGWPRWLQSFLSSPALPAKGGNAGRQAIKGSSPAPSHQHQGTISPCSSAPPGLGLDNGVRQLAAGSIEATTAHPASAIGSGPLGTRGAPTGMGALDNLPKDCHGMSLPCACVSLSGRLSLDTAHCICSALIHRWMQSLQGGRDGTCGRRRQGLLRPPSSVRLRGKTIRLGNGPAACVPVLRLVDFLSMPKSDRGEDKTWTIARD